MGQMEPHLEEVACSNSTNRLQLRFAIELTGMNLTLKDWNELLYVSDSHLLPRVSDPAIHQTSPVQRIPNTFSKAALEPFLDRWNLD